MTRQKNTDLTTTELGILDRWYEDKSGLTIFTQCGKKSKISSKFRNEVSKVKSKLESLKGNRISITTRMSTSNGKKSWTTNWFTDINQFLPLRTPNPEPEYCDTPAAYNGMMDTALYDQYLDVGIGGLSDSERDALGLD